MTLRIFLHAFRMVFGNFGPALRISMPVVVLTLAGVFLFPSFPFNMADAEMQAAQMLSGPFLIWFLLSGVAVYWVAVAWHRYCLREEYPQAVIPVFRGDRMLAYFGWSLRLGLIVVVVSVPPALLIGVVTVALQVPMAGLGLLVVWSPIALWIVQRMAMVLPAAALGEAASISNSWEATRPMSATIFLVTIPLVLFSFALSLVVDSLFAVSPVVGALANAGLRWLDMMLGLSVLTTFYGICVEGRTIE